jgi:site-specific DNA-methyltransferase (adenine-specific)
MTIELHLVDCLEFMRTMPDKSVDAVITDPPYGVNLDYSQYVDTKENLDFLIKVFVPECLRIANKVAITCGVANIHKYPSSDWTLCWHWTNTTSTGKWGFNCWQPILVYGKDPQLEAGKGRHQDAKQFNPNEGKIGNFNHPCPKPVSVMKWLVGRCSLDNWTIFDPFMGSGTTGVACVQTGRNFIGCEIDPGYFKIAEKRIHDAQQQPLLEMVTP